MRYTTCGVLTFIVTQISFVMVNSVPIIAAPKITTKAATSKITPKITPKTGKPKTATPKTQPKSTPQLAPKSTDPFSHLTPYNNGPGVMVCEPVSVSVDEETARWGAGATRWLDFVVGSQGEFGRTPSLTEVSTVPESLKRPDIRLNENEAGQLVRILGLTHAVTSRLSVEGMQLTLALKPLTLKRDKPPTPLGDVILLKGTREEIATALPDAARQIAQRLGVKEPSVPMKVDASTNEITLLGSVPVDSWQPVSADKQSALMKLAEREILAAVLALRGDQDIPKMTRLIIRRAPDNIRALAALARQGSNQMMPFADEWEPIIKQFPQNYQVSFLQVFQGFWSKDDKVTRRAAENSVRAAPDNPIAWLRLGRFIGGQADNVRKARFVGAMTQTEMSMVEKQYVLWQSAATHSVNLNSQDGEAWLMLATAATFNGSPIADKAFWTAQKLMPDSVDVYSWGTEMYQPKWGGDPAQMLKLADVMVANTKLASQLSPYIVTALRYVDMSDEHARKVVRTYLSHRMEDTTVPTPLRAAWVETQQEPENVRKWLRVEEECRNALKVLNGARLQGDLSKTETAARLSFIDLWILCSNYALYLAPKNSMCWIEFSKAKAYARRSRIPECIQEIEQAIALDPKNAEAYRWGIEIMSPLQHGDVEFFWSVVRRVVADKELLEALATDIAEVLEAIKDKNPEQTAWLKKAQDKIEDLDKEKIDDPIIQKKLGNYFRSARQYPRALKAFKNRVNLEPQSVEAHFDHGDALRKMNQIDAALAEFQESLRLDKDYAPALAQSASILYYQKKNYSEAEALYRHAIQLYPFWISPYLMLGEVLNAMGRREEAIVAWQKAASLADEYPAEYGDVVITKRRLKELGAEAQ